METPQDNPTTDSTESVPPADEWRGLADSKERRKRQNRINQRKHRQTRKWLRHMNLLPVRPGSLGFVPHTSPTGPSPPPVEQHPTAPQKNTTVATEEPSSLDVVPAVQSSSQPLHHGNPTYEDPFSSATTTLWFKFPDDKKRKALIEQLASFHNSYTTNCPMSSHLLVVTKMNIHRAFVSNMVSLGITWEWMEEDSISPFSVAGPITHPPQQSLLPTALQRSNVHHTWIDLFPCPAMRDNLIRAGNEWDDEELCVDIMGFWSDMPADGLGLIVWGEPSDLQNWEAQPGFLKKWGWVLHGCDEILRSTNRWRAKRGERPLFSASFLTSG